MRRSKKNNIRFIVLIGVLAMFLIKLMISYIWFVVSIVVLVIMIKLYLHMQDQERTQVLMKSDIDNMSGIEFEHYIQQILEHQGYDATVTKASGDLGADIIATIGSLRYSIQTKRYSYTVDRTAVSDAVAAKDHYKCNEAMVITTNYFTPGAKELAKSTRCVLVDRDQLLKWISDYLDNKEESSNATYLNWYLGAFIILSIVFMLSVINGANSLKYQSDVENRFIETGTDLQSNPINEYGAYNNPRFGYSISIPEGFIPEPPPTNGDGRSFYSQDGKGRLSVWGNHFPQTMGFNPQEYFEWVVSQTEGIITYKTIEGNWFVISGYKGDDIFYQKTFSGDDENTFLIMYPKDQKATYDDIVTTLDRSFKPSAEAYTLSEF